MRLNQTKVFSKLIKLWEAVVLICAMAFLCSCGSFNAETEKNRTESADLANCVFEFKDLGINLFKNSDYLSLDYDKDGIYGLKSTNSEGHINYSLIRLRNGETRAEEILIGSGNTRFDYLTTDKNGYFYVLRTVYPDNMGLQNATDDYVYNGKGEKKLVKYSPSGDEVWAVELTKEDMSAYIKDMAYLKGTGILTYSAEGFSLYDEATGESQHIDMEYNGDIHKDRILLTAASGKVYTAETDSKWRYVIYEFDNKKLTLENKSYLPEDVSVGAKLYTGLTYEFYYTDDNGLYAFDIGDVSSKKICDFAESGFYADDTLLFCETSKGEFEIIAYYDSGNGRAFSMKKKDSQKDDKKVIKVGITQNDATVRQQVIEFNQENLQYNIKLIDYTDTSFSGFHSVYSRILEDIESGNGPDIMILNSYADLCDFTKKGYLEPLDDYLKNDTDIVAAQYLENITNALKQNDKQYSIMPYFTINTCVAAKDVIGDETVSLSNYRNLCNKHNIKPQNMMGNVYFEGVETLYATSGFDFINFDDKTCDFQNYNFLNLITLIREIKRADDNGGRNLSEDCYVEKKAMLLPYHISNFEDYRIIKDGYFDTEISFNGYPVRDDGISYIDPGMLLCINSKSENKEIAYRFIRYFLLDEYQYSVDWGFPVNMRALDSLMDKSTQAKYYIDETGKRVNTISTITIGSKKLLISPLSSNEAGEMRAFIYSLDTLQYRDPEIVSMISESVKPYYIGELTAEKASLHVQHRIEKYLSDK